MLPDSGEFAMKKVKMLVGMVVMFLPMMAFGYSAIVVQEDYRWRNDDGSESAATWKADTNTTVSGVVRDQNIRLRFSVRETVGISGSIDSCLQYATSTNGLWTSLGLDDLTAFKMTSTARYATDDPTTAQLGSGTFVAGACVEGPETTNTTISIPGSQYSNFEYCFQPTVKAQGSMTYYFRMSELTEYTRCAQMTMAAGETEEPPVIVGPLTAEASMIISFSDTVQASGSEPITYGATGLPAGLSLNGNVISGTATTEGTYNVTLSATNA